MAHEYTNTASGVRPVVLAGLIDRELRCQGSSLADFCAAYGTTPAHAGEVLRGTRLDARLLAALADRIGVSVETLRAS